MANDRATLLADHDLRERALRHLMIHSEGQHGDVPVVMPRRMVDLLIVLLSPDSPSEPEHPSVGFYRRLLAFYAPADAMIWLTSQHDSFRGEDETRGRSPLAMIRQGRADEVDAEIDRLESGAYV